VKAHLIRHGADSLIKIPNALLDMRKSI